jgi:hypothetical protein
VPAALQGRQLIRLRFRRKLPKLRLVPVLKKLREQAPQVGALLIRQKQVMLGLELRPLQQVVSSGLWVSSQPVRQQLE